MVNRPWWKRKDEPDEMHYGMFRRRQMTRRHHWDRDDLISQRQRMDRNKSWFVPERLQRRQKQVRFNEDLETKLWWKTTEQM